MKHDTILNKICEECKKPNDIPIMVGFTITASWECKECGHMQKLFERPPTLNIDGHQLKPRDFSFEVKASTK